MYSYTFYCVLLVCCSQVFSYDMPDELFDKISLDCLEKTNNDKKIVTQSLDETFHLHKGNPKLYEFLLCVAKSKDAIKENGDINRDILHQDFINFFHLFIKSNGDKNEIANKVIDECININNDNLAERIIDLHNCLVDTSKNFDI